MTRDAGVLRDAASLADAKSVLNALSPGAADAEVRNLIDVGIALIGAATAREECRGTHTRLDFPETSPEFLGRFVFTSGRALKFVPLPTAAQARRA